MANPQPGLGSGAPAPASSSAPYRRVPRLVKRRHSASSSRSQPPPPPATPWNPFGSVGGGGSAQAATKDAPVGNSGLGSSHADRGADFAIGKGPSAEFVFGAGAASARQSPESGAAPFEFGSARSSLPRFEKGSSSSSSSSSSKLSYKMRRLKLRSSGKGGDVGKGADQKVELGKDVSFAFGVDVSSLVRNREASTLPERMTQLNIGNGAPLTGMGSEHASHPLEKFVFGSNMTSSPVDSTTDADSGVNANASSTVHGTDSNVLPEKMERLNVGRRATLDGTAGRNASCMPEAFVFGSNKTTDSVSGKSTRSTLDNSSDFIPVASANASSSANDTKGSVLPDKNSESDIGYGVPLQRMGSDSTSHPPEVFVFGSNGTTSFISGQSANRIVDNGNDFVSGTDANASTSNHGPEANTLPEKMTKLNIGCGVLSHSTESGNANRPPEVFVFGSNGATSSVSGQTTNMPFTSSRTRAFSELLNNRKCSTKHFSFQGKAEANSRYGSVPQPIIQEPCNSVRPLNSSYSFHTFQNGVSDFSFRTVNAEGVPSDFGTVKQDPSGMFTESLFGYENIKTAYRDKKEECKSTKRKKRLTRLKQRSPFHQSVSQEACTNEPELELPGDYSPMDCSPYPASAEQMTGEASTTSDESTNMHGGSASNQNSSCVEEVLVSATEHLVIDGDLPTFKQECGVHNADAIKSNVSSSSRLDEKTNLSNASQPCSGNVNVGINDEIGTTTNEAMADYYGYNIDGQTSEDNTNKQAPEFGEPFTFASNSANFSGLNFTFSASLPPQSTSSAQKRNSRRKFKMKDGQVSQPSVTQTSLQPNASQDTKGMQFSHEPRKLKNSSKEQATSDASGSAALETCDTWRTSGNQAYAKGHFATAEEHYTRGISSISHHGTAGLCSRSLMLCYSNRAATRMSLGRMREALQDCIIAASIDPSFLKAKVRAANCYLALGDFEDASRSYAECLQSNNSASSDPKIFSEASDGLERSNRVADWISQSKELLVKRTCNAASSALELISDALRICSHADNLMEMKAEALLMLQRYEAVIQLCQETMDLAERNSALRSASEELKNGSTSEKTKCPSRLWRSYLICKSYFCLGKLEEALGLLKKDEQVMPAEKRCKSSSHWSTYPECFSSLSATINQLLRLKAAGNEAFQAGRYSDAVEQYSAALAYNCESRPFSAVCFCNRAAAYQALGQVTDAIADCSLAIVLNANYPKAISRRATLYEMIRDYGQAANDLQKLISLLEKQDDQSRAARAAANKHSDLKQAHVRLSSMEDEAKKEIPLNLYLILGVDPSCSAADVKKAYRKAALRHHPDKAAQLLVRNENADDGFWRDVAEEVHADADHLFKTIGEAYNMLSDPGKRQDYDTHEELRNTKKRSFKGRTMYRSPEQHYSKQYGGFTPRQSWSNKSASHSRWAGYSDDFW